MGVSAAVVFAAVVGGTAVAVQSNQTKIAGQKQRDALGDAERAQHKLLEKQLKDDKDRKDKEAGAIQSAFTTTARSRRGPTGGDLPGAVSASAIGGQGNAAAAGKRLIGS